MVRALDAKFSAAAFLPYHAALSVLVFAKWNPTSESSPRVPPVVRAFDVKLLLRRITSVPHRSLTKFHKIIQKNLASVEISRNLTNAN